jgi:hypothetical protein
MIEFLKSVQSVKHAKLTCLSTLLLMEYSSAYKVIDMCKIFKKEYKFAQKIQNDKMKLTINYIFLRAESGVCSIRHLDSLYGNLTV